MVVAFLKSCEILLCVSLIQAVFAAKYTRNSFGVVSFEAAHSFCFLLSKQERPRE